MGVRVERGRGRQRDDRVAGRGRGLRLAGPGDGATEEGAGGRQADFARFTHLSSSGPVSNSNITRDL